MGRPAKHRICKPHPSPRFRDKVRLFNFLRGPDDDGWAAQFLINGVWQPRNPAALGTTDWDEACERARDRYAAVQAGQPIVKARASAKPQTHEHAFKVFAVPAIERLKREAREADAAVPGKGHVLYSTAKDIERHFLLKWGATAITAISENALNDWVADEVKVIDRAASAARGEFVYKTPARNTIGNLDWAFREVWLEAVKAKVVDRRARPMIRRAEHGEDGERRAFIDRAGVQALARVMTDQWIDAPDGFSPDIKRMLRCYIALISTTGIRPGLEAKRIKIGNVLFETQHGHSVIIIRVFKRQGKHLAERSVVVYERDVFPIRQLLTDHRAWRWSQGAGETDDLFGRPDGSFPDFKRIMLATLTAAGALTDSMTGKRRCAYSLRHYFATRLIELGLSVPHIAAWLGTSSKMVERHYNNFLTERNAHLLNGVPDVRAFVAPGHMPRRIGTRRTTV